MALHSGLGACETETTAAKKVAHGNRCSNLPKDFTLIHDRGMKRHKAKRREASMRPHDRGSRKTDAVSNSSAIGASSPGFIVEHRAGSGRHFGDQLLLHGRRGFRRWPAPDSDFIVFIFVPLNMIMLPIFQVESLKYRQLTYNT